MIYTYKCTEHGNFDKDFPMATTPFNTECDCGKLSTKVINLVLKGESSGDIRYG